MNENHDPNDGFAVASLVLSLVWLGGLGSLLALIFGYASRKRAQQAGATPSGLAIAGIVLGWVGIAAVVLVGIVAVLAASRHPDPARQWMTCVNSAIANGTPVGACGSAPAS